MGKFLAPPPFKEEMTGDGIDSRYRRLRAQVFLGIFIGYAGFYIVRKNFSMAIPGLETLGFHTEDLAIVLGDALTQALGDKKGINRYGMFYCPMDEALTRVVIDLSGRPYLVYDVKLAVERIGTFETEMLQDFLYALAVHGKMNLHVTTLYGTNAHHIVESVFKGLGHALRQAVAIEGNADSVLSTKGVL